MGKRDYLDDTDYLCGFTHEELIERTKKGKWFLRIQDTRVYPEEEIKFLSREKVIGWITDNGLRNLLEEKYENLLFGEKAKRGNLRKEGG